MSTRFIHTADWQLGKPFAGIEDPGKRALVQQERLNAIERIGQVAKAHGAEFILVAGDLFDSVTPTKDTVAAACSAIGQLDLPVYAIPGNHDHGGPGSLWEQRFFLAQRESLAPNLQVLLKAEPIELDTSILFPCPLLRRAECTDPTAWIGNLPRSVDESSKCRIVLAHGSTQSFSGNFDDEDLRSSSTNRIDLSRVDTTKFDYIALGDWHGQKQVGEKSWYSGTPEVDRFPKGDSNSPGHVLEVIASRGSTPEVIPVRTGRLGWHEIVFDIADDAALTQLRQHVEGVIQGRARADLLRLDLSGSLGIGAAAQLEDFLESLSARVLRIKLTNRTTVAPTPDEIDALTRRVSDPLIARVASQLVLLAAGADARAAVARTALRELHTFCTNG